MKSSGKIRSRAELIPEAFGKLPKIAENIAENIGKIAEFAGLGISTHLLEGTEKNFTSLQFCKIGVSFEPLSTFKNCRKLWYLVKFSTEYKNFLSQNHFPAEIGEGLKKMPEIASFSQNLKFGKLSTK